MEKRINKFRGWLPRKPMKFDKETLPDLEENESFTAPFSRSRIHQWVFLQNSPFKKSSLRNYLSNTGAWYNFHFLFCACATWNSLRCLSHTKLPHYTHTEEISFTADRFVITGSFHCSFIIHNKETFFNNATRSRIVHHILQRVKYEEGKNKMGEFFFPGHNDTILEIFEMWQWTGWAVVVVFSTLR